MIINVVNTQLFCMFFTFVVNYTSINNNVQNLYIDLSDYFLC